MDADRIRAVKIKDPTALDIFLQEIAAQLAESVAIARENQKWQRELIDLQHELQGKLSGPMTLDTAVDMTEAIGLLTESVGWSAVLLPIESLRGNLNDWETRRDRLLVRIAKRVPAMPGRGAGARSPRK